MKNINNIQLVKDGRLQIVSDQIANKVHEEKGKPLLPLGFELREDGLYYVGQEGEGEWICSSIEVVAYTRDEHSQNWGRILKFKDLDNYCHNLAVPMDSLKGDGIDFFGMLLNHGLTITTQKKYRSKLPEYVQNIKLDKRAICTSRVGWHGKFFVLPDTSIPKTDEVYLQSNNSYFEGFRHKGTLEEWKEHIAVPCRGNSRLIFAKACSFAAPLFPILNEESGGFNFRGASSIGKSTALKVSASVWGSPKYIQQWKATGNALEAVAEAHNNTLLCLDELGQSNNVESGEIIYMLSNGSGKNRLKATGELRKKFQWNLLFLSTGEVSINDKMNEVGKKARAGMLTRMVDIPADAKKGHKLFDTIHDFENGSIFANSLKEKVSQYYGTPIREFLLHLARIKEEGNLSYFVDRIRENFFKLYVPQGSDGQISRVASRFVVVAAAGELAIELGILPYDPDEVLEAVGTCFEAWLEAWLEERGSNGNYETEEAVRQVRTFVEAHYSSRFMLIGEGINPMLQEKISNLAGYKRKTLDGHYEFCVFPGVFDKEVCKGLDSKFVKETLADQGLLVRNSEGKYTSQTRVPGLKGRPRLVILAPSILVEEDLGDEV